jgi:hypothetical protein
MSLRDLLAEAGDGNSIQRGDRGGVAGYDIDHRRAKKRDDLHPAYREEMAEGQAHNQMLTHSIIGM